MGAAAQERAGAGQRSRIVLECASGSPNNVVADQLGVTYQTVGKWAQRFLERRLAGLLDEPRPGAPRQVGDAQIERVGAHDFGARAGGRHALEYARDGQALRLKSEHGEPHLASLCAATASSRGFKLSKDPLFIEKVRDTSGFTSIRRPRAGLVRRREEPDPGTRSQSAAVPMRPGQAERRAPDYLRHGTTNLFAALDFKAGTVIGQFHHRHRAVEFRQFLETMTTRSRPGLRSI